MGKKVDISEVDHFSEQLSEASTNLHSQLVETKNSIESVNGMNSFSGKAADAAKSYFTDVHLTLLESFGNLFEDLEANVEQHKKAFSAKVDMCEDAIIQSTYLQEVKEEIKEEYDKLEGEDETIHDTIQEVSDISSAMSPNFSDVNEWKNNSVEKIQEVDEDLDAFTSTGDESDVEEIMHQIEVVMESASANDGQARFTDFIGASRIRELQKLKAYNVLRRPNSDEIVKELREKMLKDETLNEEEREIVYMHLQNKLSSEDIEKINETKDYLLNDNEELKTYINESVLSTEASLEDEIILLEEYLYTGNLKPGELEEDTHERVALRSYLDALKNYHVSINEVKNDLNGETDKNDPLYARVEHINFNIEGSTQYSGYGNLDTQIAISYDQEDSYENREEFLNLEPQFEDAFPVLGYHNNSNIEYYYGQDAVTNRMEVEDDELKDDMKTATGEYIGSEILGLGIGMTRSTVSIPLGILLSGAEHLHQKKKWKRNYSGVMLKNLRINLT